MRIRSNLPLSPAEAPTAQGKLNLPHLLDDSKEPKETSALRMNRQFWVAFRSAHLQVGNFFWPKVIAPNLPA